MHLKPVGSEGKGEERPPQNSELATGQTVESTPASQSNNVVRAGCVVTREVWREGGSDPLLLSYHSFACLCSQFDKLSLSPEWVRRLGLAQLTFLAHREVI